MISTFKLPFSFDPKPLQADLDRIAAGDWVAHFNAAYFEGQWSGVALRSTDGQSNRIYPDAHTKVSYADTPMLDRCPNVRAILELFKCPLRSVRFLGLAPGSLIKEHRDFDLRLEDGQARLHIPIRTNAEVDFFLDAHRIELHEGECWYLNLSLPHWVENRGSTDRIHLVIDCEVNEWLLGLLPAAAAREDKPQVTPVAIETACSPEEFQRFRLEVLSDLKLQRQVRVTADWESFARLAVELGKERGYRFEVAQVEQALLANRQAWLAKWID